MRRCQAQLTETPIHKKSGCPHEDLPLREWDGKHYCLLHLPEDAKTGPDWEWKGGDWQTFDDQLQKTISGFSRSENKNVHRLEFNALDLRGVVFPNSISFGTYTGDNPLPPADFTLARFIGNSDFKGVVFREYADFSGVVFRWISDFRSAVFESSARFDQASFGEALFGSATFMYGVSFRHALFEGAGDFYGVVFNKEKYSRFDSFAYAVGYEPIIPTHFDEAVFRGNAIFNSAVFNKLVHFNGVRFHKNGFFSSVAFHGEVSFADGFFAAGVDFRNGEFRGHALFTHSRFAEPPLLDGTTFMGDVDFERTRFERGDEHFFRRMRRLMVSTQRWWEAAWFHGMELEAQWHRLPLWKKWGGTLNFWYWLFGDYGRSIWRPVLWILVSLPLVAALAGGADPLAQAPGVYGFASGSAGWDPAWRYLMFAVQNLNPASLVGVETPLMATGFPVWMLARTHSLLVMAWLVMALVTVVRRFRR